MSRTILKNATVVSMNERGDIFENAEIEISEGRITNIRAKTVKNSDGISAVVGANGIKGGASKSHDGGTKDCNAMDGGAKDCNAMDDGATAFNALDCKDATVARVHEAQKEQSPRIIDCGGDIIMPALINTHSHLAMTLFRGLADDVSLNDFLYKRIFPLEKRMTGGDAYAGAMLGISELVSAGIVGTADMYMFCGEMVSALQKNSMYGRVIIGGNDLDGRTGERLENAERDFLQYRNGDVSVWLGAHAEYTCSEEYLDGIAFLSNKYKAPVCMHLSETLYETGGCAKRHNNLSPTQYIHSLGLMEYGGITAHCVYCDKDDIALLKQQGMTVSLNLGSNLKLGSGIPQLGSLISSGVNLTLGTDSAASNNRLDIMREMYLASVLAKGVQNDPQALDSVSALKMAGQNGFKALGLDGGIIAEGKSADLVRLEFKPLVYNKDAVLSGIVYSSQASQVKMTMVKGRILYENGEYYLSENIVDIRNEAKNRLNALMN